MKNLKPLTIKLKGDAKYTRILGGILQTAGLRCGYVNLKPGEDIGEHDTGNKEEVIVILSGKAQIFCEGYPSMTAESDSVIYVPVGTKHNVKNTGFLLLKYLYIVNPLA